MPQTRFQGHRAPLALPFRAPKRRPGRFVGRYRRTKRPGRFVDSLRNPGWARSRSIVQDKAPRAPFRPCRGAKTQGNPDGPGGAQRADTRWVPGGPGTSLRPYVPGCRRRLVGRVDDGRNPKVRAPAQHQRERDRGPGRGADHERPPSPAEQTRQRTQDDNPGGAPEQSVKQPEESRPGSPRPAPPAHPPTPLHPARSHRRRRPAPDARRTAASSPGSPAGDP